MDDAAAQQPKMRSRAIMAHVAQIVVTVTVMGLASYGIDYISYNVLIYSATVCACSLLVSSWLIASKTFLTKFDHIFVSLGLHVWMLVCWIVNLGLTAHLARDWSPQCSYADGADKICETFVTKRDTTFKTYFGALVASAVLIGLQILLWLGTTALVALDFKRRRATVSQATVGGPAARFSADSQATAGDFEKQANVFDNVSSVPIRDHASPVLPPASPDIESEQVEPFQPNSVNSHPAYLSIPAPAKRA